MGYQIDTLFDRVRTVLQRVDLYTPAVGNLIVGTVCAESACGTYRQIGGGPALGICQMEPATHDDIVANNLRYRSKLAGRILDAAQVPRFDATLLETNDDYAILMCRIHYLRVPAPIPWYVVQQAWYWKQYYNTPLGAGTEDKYLAAWAKYVRHEL